jgi:predicted CXXCH cytochrome family protein
MGYDRKSLFVFLAVYALALCACSRGPDQPVAQAPAQVAARGERAAASGYVGSQRCAACHARNYHSWRGTRHAAMLAEADTRSVGGDFARAQVLALPDGASVSMREKDGRRVISLEGAGRDREDLAVAYVLGGARRQMYVAVSRDGRLVVPPAQWNVAAGRWGSPDGPDGATDDWLRDCAGCHVTGLGQAASAPGAKTWAEDGVGCEACHGPGARHAGAKNPEKPDTIFNPGTVPEQARAVMVCGRCHTRGVSADGKGYPDRFEPGDDFRRGFEQARPGDVRFFWPDGSSRANRQQYADFTTSAMYARGVKCWSCHNPHKASENNAASLRLAGSALCRSCHPASGGEKGLTHAIHDNGACRGCHMPLTADPGPGGGLASHRFMPVRPAATLELGGGDTARQPNSCNGCHYHGKQPPEQLEAYLQARVKGHYDALDRHGGQAGQGGQGARKGP